MGTQMQIKEQNDENNTKQYSFQTEAQFGSPEIFICLANYTWLTNVEQK